MIIKRIYISIITVLFFYLLWGFSNLDEYLSPATYLKINQEYDEQNEIAILIKDDDFPKTGKLKIEPAFRLENSLESCISIDYRAPFRGFEFIDSKPQDEEKSYFLNFQSKNNRPNYEKLRILFPKIIGDLSRIEKKYSEKISDLSLKSYLNWLQSIVVFSVLYVIVAVLVWYFLMLVFKLISIYLDWLLAKNDTL